MSFPVVLNRSDVVGRFDRPPLRIVDLDTHRPQPFDEYLGHARSVAVPVALQVPEGGLDMARRQALVQTPLPGARLLVAGERRPAAPVVRVVHEPRRRPPPSPAPSGRPAGRSRVGSPFRSSCGASVPAAPPTFPAGSGNDASYLKGTPAACSRVPITTSRCDFTSRPSGGMRWRSTGSPSLTAAERAFRRSATSAASPGSRSSSSRIQPAILRSRRPSSSAIGESWTVWPSTSLSTGARAGGSCPPGGLAGVRASPRWPCS